MLLILSRLKNVSKRKIVCHWKLDTGTQELFMLTKFFAGWNDTDWPT